MSISHESTSAPTSILFALWHLTSVHFKVRQRAAYWPGNYLHAWTWAFVWHPWGCESRFPLSNPGGRTQRWYALWYTSGRVHIPPPSWILGLPVKNNEAETQVAQTLKLPHIIPTLSWWLEFARVNIWWSKSSALITVSKFPADICGEWPQFQIVWQRVSCLHRNGQQCASQIPHWLKRNNISMAF